MSRTVKTLVALSLLLNLLLAGFILGHAGRSMIADRVHDGIEQTAETLSPEKRAAFRESMHRSTREGEPLFKQMDAAREKSMALLKAEPFNEKAFIAQGEEMNRIHAKLKQHLAQSIVKATAGLGPEDRARVAEMMRRPPPPSGECERLMKKQADKQ